MNPDRAIGFVLTVSLAAVLLLGVWLLRGAHRDNAIPAPIATAPPQPTLAPTATPPVLAPPPAANGYRLAGTVVGDLAYAIIEDPRGANQLYRVGQVVPGLGELTAIEADRITLSGSGGSFVLQLAPAAPSTPTPLPTILRRAESASAPTPARRLPADQSTSESSP
jgi:hypothetical protein